MEIRGFVFFDDDDDYIFVRVCLMNVCDKMEHANLTEKIP